MNNTENSPINEAVAENGNTLLMAGTTVGAVGAAGALLAGAVCPLCIIATPLLLGTGLVRKLRNRHRGKRLIESGG